MTPERLAWIRSRFHMRDQCPILQAQLRELCDELEAAQRGPTTEWLNEIRRIAAETTPPPFIR